MPKRQPITEVECSAFTAKQRVEFAPGADHLSDAENNHLAYELERRAWNAREDSADPRVLLAEIRGHRAGINDVRIQLGYMADAASTVIADMENQADAPEVDHV